MRRTLLAALALCALASPTRAADEYALDDAHAAVLFRISHIGLSWTCGRFNGVSGTFGLDADDPGRAYFALTVQADSLDTANKKRDDHLRSPDFFNVKQYPVITFKS